MVYYRYMYMKYSFHIEYDFDVYNTFFSFFIERKNVGTSISLSMCLGLIFNLFAPEFYI
jgi:hypothetical protein